MYRESCSSTSRLRLARLRPCKRHCKVSDVARFGSWGVSTYTAECRALNKFGFWGVSTSRAWFEDQQPIQFLRNPLSTFEYNPG